MTAVASWSETVLRDRDSFDLIGGLWKGKKPPFAKATVVRNTNFAELGALDLSDVAVLDVEERQLASRHLLPGDLIIERSGGGPKQPVGRVCYFDIRGGGPYSFSNFTSVVRIRDHNSISPRFLAYYLLYLHASGATVPLQRATTGLRNLDWDAYTQLPIPLPPRLGQVRIAAVLLKVQRAIEVEEKLIATTRELKRAAMAQLFTRGLRGETTRDTELGPLPESWGVQSFSELREFLQYGTSTKCDYQREGNPVLRIPNVIDGRVQPADLKWCRLLAREVEGLLLADGDLLFVRTNGVRERVGTCAAYRGSPEHSLFASYLIRARLKKQMLIPEFFAYYASTPTGAGLLAGRSSPAADGKFNINTRTIDSVIVPVPHTSEQEEIVTTLHRIDAAIDLHERRRVVLGDLFTSLLDKLMTGAIRVDDLDIDTSAVEAP